MYDLISRMVFHPLVETAAEIDEEIERQLAREFVLRDEGAFAVSKAIGQYFKALSESEPAR